MIKYLKIFTILLFSGIVMTACLNDYPTDENGMLITDREDCYISQFELLGSDGLSVLVDKAVIDEENLTITAIAKFGTDLKYVKPYCNIATDALLTPRMGTWIDFTSPRKYTVISGNRQVKKEYTITVTLQE